MGAGWWPAREWTTRSDATVSGSRSGTAPPAYRKSSSRPSALFVSLIKVLLGVVTVVVCLRPCDWRSASLPWWRRRSRPPWPLSTPSWPRFHHPPAPSQSSPRVPTHPLHPEDSRPPPLPTAQIALPRYLLWFVTLLGLRGRRKRLPPDVKLRSSSRGCPAWTRVSRSGQRRRMSWQLRTVPPSGGWSRCVHLYGEESSPLPRKRSEERRVGKECRSRWSPKH